jgi:O-antigen/teichoic acid export membrane protein
MSKSLKKQTIFGIMWNGLGNTGSSLISFVSNIVLARLLLPSDFGCIAMLYVFMALSNTLINGGFGAALIQKKDPTKEDYNTVFYWNIIAALLLYFILFFFSPVIARFYQLPQLSSVLRIHAIALVTSSLGMIQRTQLVKNLKFKEISKVVLISISCGTITAITMAYCGFGVWSLVASNLVHSVMGVLLFWKKSSWRPAWCFSFKSFKELFSFGGLIALVGIINTLYGNIQALIIGKRFSATDVGYFNQAKRLEFVPSDTVTMIVDQVTFPVFSKIREDATKLVSGIRTNVKAVSFLNFALYVLLIIIAYPLIHLIYGDKWDAAIPYFQILCLAGMVYSLDKVNLNVIKSLGKGTLFFLTQIITRIVGISIIFLGMRWGIYGLLWALVLSSYLNFFVSSVVRSRVVNYSLVKQLGDILPSLLLAIFAGFVSWLLGRYIDIHFVLKMLVQSLIFAAVYLGLSYLIKLDGYLICKDAAISILKRKK